MTAVRGRRRSVAILVGTAVAAVALAGCGSDSGPPDPQTIPPGPDVSPPPESPISPSAAPSTSVNAAAGCLGAPQLLEAMTFADPDSAPSERATVGNGPICEAGWAYASIAEPGLDPAGVVLRHTAGRWQVLTFGSTPCAEPRVADAPAKIRAAAGC
jgi:hypothetical protein